MTTKFLTDDDHCKMVETFVYFIKIYFMTSEIKYMELIYVCICMSNSTGNRAIDP